MTFTSYAQNCEDVLLWRALKGVQRGQYIDVGASHPVIDSVTWAFYQRGWRGINIEPVAADHALLQEQRSGDVNLQLAAGDRTTTMQLYQFGVRGLATLSESVTERHRQHGLAPKPSEVKVVPLRDICAEYVTGSDIHFLKIDVEGSEASVLRGMDFERWRPWILLIEATAPNSQEATHAEWEPLLLQHQYEYCYFDGLSRYYVASERKDTLGPRLACQPNVFDDFTSAKLASTIDEVSALKQKLDEVTRRWEAMPDAASAVARVELLEKQLAERERELAAAREAFTASEVSSQTARQRLAECEVRLAALKADPYFRTGETIRALTQRLAGRSNP
jgi:FkbM family methyltransferase